MTSKLPVWQVGDTVYALRLDPVTGRYRVHGEGRVVRIEGGVLHLATTKGPKTTSAASWPAFKTRAEGEAYIAEQSRPGGNRGQMAHYGPSSAAAVEQWECLRCARLLAGLDPAVPDHSPRCIYRGTGRDPELRG